MGRNGRKVDHQICQAQQRILVNELKNVEQTLIMRSSDVNVAQVDYLDDNKAEDLL